MRFAPDGIMKTGPITKESINSTRHYALRENENKDYRMSAKAWSFLTDYFESSRW